MPNVNMQKHVASIITIVCFIGSVICKSVRVTELRVPAEAVLGESVLLVCSYDLGSEELYVVKWYKDDLEFYRYEPKDHNQSVYFPQPGIDIDLSQSGSNAVFLRNLALDSAGAYKCQVSTDAPTYSCVQAVKEMDIIIMPLSGPIISGGEDGYDFGDNVTLNCTSSKSKPAAVLSWLINGKPVTEAETFDHGVTLDTDNLQVSSKSLRLHVKESLFQNGKLSVNCEANFYGRIIVSGKEFTLSATENEESSARRSQILLKLLLICLTLLLTFR